MVQLTAGLGGAMVCAQAHICKRVSGWGRVMRRKAGVEHWRWGATVPRPKFSCKGQGSTLLLVRCTSVSCRVVARQPESRRGQTSWPGTSLACFRDVGPNGNATRFQLCRSGQNCHDKICTLHASKFHPHPAWRFRSRLTHQDRTAHGCGSTLNPNIVNSYFSKYLVRRTHQPCGGPAQRVWSGGSVCLRCARRIILRTLMTLQGRRLGRGQVVGGVPRRGRAPRKSNRCWSRGW